MPDISIGEIVTSYAFKKTVDTFINLIQKQVLISRRQTISDTFFDRLSDILVKVANEASAWAEHVEYVQNQDSRDLTKIYIELDIFVEPISELPGNINKKKK